MTEIVWKDTKYCFDSEKVQFLKKRNDNLKISLSDEDIILTAESKSQKKKLNQIYEKLKMQVENPVRISVDRTTTYPYTGDTVPYYTYTPNWSTSNDLRKHNTSWGLS